MERRAVSKKLYRYAAFARCVSYLVVRLNALDPIRNLLTCIGLAVVAFIGAKPVKRNANVGFGRLSHCQPPFKTRK
jgi:hypothetical protein